MAKFDNIKRDKLREREVFDRFVGVLQHLDVTKDLIHSNAHEKSRMALILLHSLVEGLMYSEVIKEFDSDIYFSRIVPPKYSARDRKNILRFFDEKIDLCFTKIRIVSEQDAKIFKILNFYRNVAYHRNSHNPNVVSAIARSAFHAGLRLFERTAVGWGGVGGQIQKEISILSRYCKVESFIDYGELSKAIALRFSKELPISHGEIRSALINDITTRLKNLGKMKKESLYCKSKCKLDKLLKKAAFELEGIDDKLYSEVKQLNYRIAKKVPGGEPKREEYLLAKNRYSEKLKKSYDSFKPPVSVKTFDFINNELQTLATKTSLEVVLSQYLEIDKLLVEVEDLFTHAKHRIDETIQFQIDLERGK